MCKSKPNDWYYWSGQQDSNLRPPAPKLRGQGLEPHKMAPFRVVLDHPVRFRFARFLGVAWAMAAWNCGW